MTLDKNIKAFVVYISTLISNMTIYLACNAQIASLFVKKVTVLAKYSDFANVFSKKSKEVFSRCIGSNKPAIKPEKKSNHLMSSSIV